MERWDFTDFPNVELIDVDHSELDEDRLAVLYQQARYCQAMTDADTDTLRKIIAEDTVFTHMSGRQQAREAYRQQHPSPPMYASTNAHAAGAASAPPERYISPVSTAALPWSLPLNVMRYGGGENCRH